MIATNRFLKTERKPKGHASPDEKTNSDDIALVVKRRIYVFAIAIVVLMSILLCRLFDVQILQNSSYINKLSSYTSRYRRITTPRGEIYDTNNNLLVTNHQVIEIVYYPAQDATKKSEWEVAQHFAQVFNVVGDTLTTRDLKDLFLFLYPSEGTAKITEADWAKYQEGVLTDNDIYYLKLERITETDLAKLSEEEKNGWSVYASMNTATVSQFAVIKDDVSFDEISYFLEHIEEFRGFDITIDWEREYMYGNTLRNMLGSITTSRSGIPAEKLYYYLAQDYSRNEKTGRSGLELQYEELLSGERAVYNLSYNDEGMAVLDEVTSGSKGYDLKLALDVELQAKIEEIVINTFEENASSQYRKYWDTTYVVVMDPNTGDVLALVGVKKTEDGYYLDPVSTYTESVVVGSAVKGATMYMGLDSGVVSEGEYIMDAPIKIKDTPLKASHANLGRINDLQALSLSSNVYMFHIAMRLGGATYQYDQPLNINVDAFDTMRNYYSQFGLGVLTGIDLPSEGRGYAGSSSAGGNLLDYAIGQYSTYTPIQMAQYISTIANGGYLMRPRVLTEAYESGTQNIVYQNNPEVLSSLDNSAALSRVQRGFRSCVVDGLCKAYLSTLSVPVAAKTGTAENTLAEDSSVSSPNSTLVAYAPYDEPKVAIACAAVNAWNDKSQVNICSKISADVLAYYFSER